MSSNALLWPSQGTKPEERLDKYKYLKLPSQGVGGVGVAPPQTFRVIASFPAAADETFQFYKIYRINGNQTQGAETNVPVVILVDLPAGSLQDLTNGFDIRVFDSSNNPIPYEAIDTVVLGDGSATFELWLNMPLVIDGEFIQLAFGKAAATDGSNPAGVYDSNYTSVYHLNGIGDDSSVNAEDFTLNSTPGIAAKIGTGLSFAGAPTSFTIRNPYNSFPLDAITTELWLQTTGNTDTMLGYAVGPGNPSQNHFVLFRQNALQVLIQGAGTNNGIFNDGVFHHLVVTWRSSDGQRLIYDNGVLIATAILQQGTTFTNNGSVVLGQSQLDVGVIGSFTNSYSGILEEVKISDNIRNADYVFSTFKNQNDNAAFWDTSLRLDSGETHFLVDDLGNNIVTEITP